MALPPEILLAYHYSGLTQEQLAERVGVSRTTISDWVTGKIQPRARNIARLRQALGLEAKLSAEGTVLVTHYRLGPGKLIPARDKHIIDAATASGVPREALGTLFVPAGWDAMIGLVRPGDRLIVQVYEPPVMLSQAVQEGLMVDGVYLISLRTTLQLRRLQELPEGVVLMLSDNAAYRPVELHLDAGQDLTLHARCLYAEGLVKPR